MKTEEQKKEEKPESLTEQYAWAFIVPVFWCTLFAYPLRYSLSHTFLDADIPEQYVMNPSTETGLIFLLLIAWYSDAVFLARIQSEDRFRSIFFYVGWTCALVLTVSVIVLLCWLLFDNEGYHLAWG